MACFPIKVSAVTKHFAQRAAMAPIKQRDYASGAAAAYDAQECKFAQRIVDGLTLTERKNSDISRHGVKAPAACWLRC
jgi:hypothetical protein